MKAQEMLNSIGNDNNKVKEHPNSPDLSKNCKERLSAQKTLTNKNRADVAGGRPITEELAIELRDTAFGSASLPPRSDWIQSPLSMGPPGKSLAFGLVAPRNNTRSLLTGLQAYIIKWILFDSRLPTASKKLAEPPESYLLLSEEQQEEALWRACSEVIWRCTTSANRHNGEKVAVVALPTTMVHVQNSLKYYQDGVTEKLHIFELSSEEELQIFMKRYLYVFQADVAPGALLLLYAVILTRGCGNVRKDLDGKMNYLTSAKAEGSLNITMLLLTGRATPYLHNGVIYVGDEENYALPQFGVLSRSAVGLLLWYEGIDKCTTTDKPHPGSRLKTPSLPIWVTNASEHYGVLFNTNRELLKNYQAEKRFDIHFYTVDGCHALINVDTRVHVDSSAGLWEDEIHATALEKLIHTKWQDAKITCPSLTSKVKKTSK